jgi:hypothetical protein
LSRCVVEVLDRSGAAVPDEFGKSNGSFLHFPENVPVGDDDRSLFDNFLRTQFRSRLLEQNSLTELAKDSTFE